MNKQLKTYTPIALKPSPEVLTDSNGMPQFGTYQGELRRINLADLLGSFNPGVARHWKRKRWQFTAVSTPEVLLVTAVVHANYAANAFSYAIDLTQKELLFDHSFMALPDLQIQIGDRPAQGHRASFRSLGATIRTTRGFGQKPYTLELRVKSFLKRFESVRSQCDIHTAGQPQPLTVIAPVPEDGVVNCTQKWAGLPTDGYLQVGNKRYSLDNGVAGLDYTQGYLARHTAWRWALGIGRLKDGTPLGLNLVEGFNENSNVANENGLWIGDRFYPLARARFLFNKKNLMEPWQIYTRDGTVDLRFSPIHLHTENRDFKVLKSYFVQPGGVFEGTIKVDGTTYDIEDLPGMSEDQDIYW